MTKLMVELERVPATCTVDDVCRLLAIKRSVFYERRDWLRELGVLVPVVPQITRRPTYQGAAIARFLNADGQADQMRKVLRRVG